MKRETPELVFTYLHEIFLWKHHFEFLDPYQENWETWKKQWPDCSQFLELAKVHLPGISTAMDDRETFYPGDSQ